MTDEVLCKGSYALDSACGQCVRCAEERVRQGFHSHEDAVDWWSRVHRPKEESIAPQWTTTAPTEPGFYWYRDRRPGEPWNIYAALLGEDGLWRTPHEEGVAFTPKEMAYEEGQFWPVALVPPPDEA